MEDDRKSTYAKDGKAWRKWLQKNHQKEQNIWLIIYKKKSDTPSVYIGEAIDEAICFGWIDSKSNKRDEDSYYVYFAKRNPKSNWSRVNKEKIKRLEEADKIAPAGYEMIRIAKETGTWTALNDVENLIKPVELQVALDKNPLALENFDKFPRSAKRAILEWLFNAKRPATKAKRIKEIVEKAAQNIRANYP